MSFLSRPRRQRRPGEWSADRAVTFVVTLAATRSVTLAARAAGMSRKSAYALKARDPAFAAAWLKAARVAPPRSRHAPDHKRPQGDKADKADTPPAPARQGNKPLTRRAHLQAFAELVMALRDSGRLAPRGTAQ